MSDKEMNSEIKVEMMKAVSEVLRLKKNNKNADHESIMVGMDSFIHKVKDKDSRLMMIVAASKTLDTLEKNSKMGEKEIMKKLVGEFDSMIDGAKNQD